MATVEPYNPNVHGPIKRGRSEFDWKAIVSQLDAGPVVIASEKATAKDLQGRVTACTRPYTGGRKLQTHQIDESRLYIAWAVLS